MSHVTTSAVVATTGAGRLATLPETQLASSERFHDFLESYVHPETPAHAAISQKTSINRPDATKAASSPTGEKAQNQISKPISGMQTAVKRTEASGTGQQSNPLKQVGATPKAEAVPSQKNIAASSKEQTEKPAATVQQKTAQTAPAKAGERYSLPSPQSQEKSSPDPEMTVAASDKPVTDSAPPQENASLAVPVAAGAEETSQRDSLSPESTLNSVQEVSGAEVSSPKEGGERRDVQESKEEKGFSVSDISPSTENAVTIHTESASSEKISTASEAAETSDTAQPENTQAAVDDQEQVARHGDQQPLLYQKSSDGNKTTHIEMNVGLHEKVHVEIGETTAKEQRIRINTDNPEVYQSLKDNHDTLLASLTESAVPAVVSQPIIPANIQISLSQPSFFDMSSHDERQKGDSQSSGTSRGGLSSEDAPVAGRRLLRSVVDLTV